MNDVRINPEWEAWIIEQQRKNGEIMALATAIIAISTIFQLLKIYEISTPSWVYLILIIPLILCFVGILGILYNLYFKKEQ